MTNVTEFPTQKCCECGARATLMLELENFDTGQPVTKGYCETHFPRPLTEDDLRLLVDARDQEIAILKQRLSELARAADTAELLLRNDYPAEAASLRQHVAKASTNGPTT